MSHSTSHPTTTPVPAHTTTAWPRIAGRWMVSFLGFPIGGYAAFHASVPLSRYWTLHVALALSFMR